jgi:hypothetical protein
MPFLNIYFKMKYVSIVIGFILVAIGVVYFVELAKLLQESYEFTNYGLGILAGKTILLLLGIFLVIWGIKKSKA